VDRVAEIVARYFQTVHGELNIGRVPVRSIATRAGTPLFVYDRSVLDRKWERLRNALPAEFNIAYSIKANPHPEIVRFFLSKGCGVEIASGGELFQVLRTGCPPEKILFAGPGKTPGELESALTNDIGEIHAESMLEVDRIADLARRLNARARVGIRVNPKAEAQGGAMRMGGKSVPFGIDEEDLDEAVRRVLAHPAIEFRGIHLFAGTQILDYAVLAAQYRKGLEIARRVALQLRRPLHTIDFGGGLGVPYFANEEELDLDKLRLELASVVAEIKGEKLFDGTRLIVEPGRFLVAEAGVFITTINDIKVSRGKKFLVVDGGMNHHLAASGNLGQVIKRNFPVALLNKVGQEPKEIVDVVGPLCTPLDVLARDVRLPQAEVGDLVGVFQSGAYARTSSPLGFLSHPTPPEVLVDGGEVRLIRRRGTYDDLVDDIL
jgi:diaminopimelate decarboxylase